MTNRIYSFLGLAMKAGKAISGEETCERAVKAGKVELVIVAEDASLNTKKKFEDMCSFRNLEIRVFGNKEDMGRSMGKDVRSVAAIVEKGFAKKMMEMIDNKSSEFGGEYYGKV
ncbi:MAG: ribosomal L7Ae/L30e/S12e/Gadd45 family protein [Clostridiales bacterium]|jgi:ribosomal protein L7Ae-like RNA K-turn-binding protein|nr:ribosomal L7Ae/L30e/S12e/Gadd45 family protein [Eubacteriales bacterium]MDH7564908.1 ribosomal L7Ae/L30e/S12e/Gadd45 family protein [Clostridiales bacterium]